MQQYHVKSSKLHGEIEIPSSKSHTLRALLFGALGSGKSVIFNYLPSKDTAAMIKACQLFGAKIKLFEQKLEIDGLDGHVTHTDDVIDAGNSGLVLRFCSAIGALASRPVVVTGDESIRYQRPMQTLLDALSQLGLSAISMRGDGYAPVIIQGPIKAAKATLCGADSQPVSALLIASAFATHPIELTVQNPGEKPWVGMTLAWFERLGITYTNENFTKYKLTGNSRYCGFKYSVPGDFSSAAFPIAAALITKSEIVLKNVDTSDVQGDKALIAVLQRMGGQIEVDDYSRTLKVKETATLMGITVDINDFIDAITILAVVACFASTPTNIYNAAIAKQKECNRINSIATELRKMGADIMQTDDGLIINPSQLKGATVCSYGDHRMAMSLIVAGLGAQGETIVGPVECIAKTFPTFLNDFNVLGAKIK